MNRTQPVTADKAKPEVKQIYDGISKKLGRLPNIFQHMGNSPAVLEGYLGLLVEVILVISATLFTNYFNHITDPALDFPPAPPLN
jgi:hypothetical protein